MKMKTETKNDWDSQIDRLLVSLESSRQSDKKRTELANAQVSKELRERILTNAGKSKTPKRSPEEDF